MLLQQALAHLCYFLTTVVYTWAQFSKNCDGDYMSYIFDTCQGLALIFIYIAFSIPGNGILHFTSKKYTTQRNKA